MNTLFDNDMRALKESELVYKVTNRKEFSLSEELTFDDIIESLTPARKEMAKATIELYKRFQLKKPINLRSSLDLYEYMNPIISDLNKEEFWIVCLNQAYGVIKRVRLSVGALNATIVDVRLVLKEALSCCAVSMMAVHNHPSGNICPSREDDKITDNIVKAGKLMNIELVDHVIIGKGKFYSYADEGKI